MCDIDFYTEAAVGIAVRPARHGRLGFLDLVTGLKNEDLHSYVLSLPVSSEIAQVRGHDGYGFPKWVTGLDVEIDHSRTAARVANDSGGLDLALQAPTPRQTAQAGRGAGHFAHLVHDDQRWVALDPQPDQRAERRYHAQHQGRLPPTR